MTTVKEWQALLPVSLEDRLRGLVELLRAQADRASRDADAAAKVDHYQEGLAGGKMMSYRETAAMLETLLDRLVDQAAEETLREAETLLDRCEKRQAQQAPGGIVFVESPDPRAIKPSLVAVYRKAADRLQLARKWSPFVDGRRPGPSEQELLQDVYAAAVEVAVDVMNRADAIVTADASLLGRLRSLVHSAVYTIGNPMSGLGGDTTAQAALGTLREAEELLDAAMLLDTAAKERT